jgi:hypothetical protein
MRYLVNRLFLTIGLAAMAILPVVAQEPSPTPKQVTIQSVSLESASMPGSSRAWTKVVTHFQSAPRWADGVVFSYTVLLGAMDQFRVLPGVVRYANVKGGNNRAVMYISPNTAERFGPPIAARVKAFYKDEMADDFLFKTQAALPSNWENQYNKYPGLLLTVINTPWVISDYSASPDIFATQ